MGYFRNRTSGGTRLRREMEIKEFRVACGEFAGLSDIRRKDWERTGKALVPYGASWAAGMFAARAGGDSMEPMIRNRMWCLFHRDVVGTRQHRFVLVEDRSKNGIDRYTLKKYFSRKINSPEGTWEHEEIWLLPMNPEFSAMRLEDEGNYRICGWFVGAHSHESAVSISLGTDMFPSSRKDSRCCGQSTRSPVVYRAPIRRPYIWGQSVTPESDAPRCGRSAGGGRSRLW